MLVVNYNGNKPIADRHKFSVQGNNNADVIRFVLNKQQGSIDLTSTSLKIYAKSQSPDKSFLDKEELTAFAVEGNEIHIDWKLKAKHTANKLLEVALSFENLNNLVWQTQLFSLSIANCVASDEEVENKYPSIIADHEQRIEDLEQGGGGGLAFNDITIKSMRFYFEEGRYLPIEYASPANTFPFWELQIGSDKYFEASNIKVEIITNPIDDRFLSEIKKGLAVLRFDYPIARSRTPNDFARQTHRGFARNLNAYELGNPNGKLFHKDILERSLIFISEDDVQENAYGEKYVYIKKRFIDILGNSCDFESVDGYWQRKNPRQYSHNFLNVPAILQETIHNDQDTLFGGTWIGISSQEAIASSIAIPAMRNKYTQYDLDLKQTRETPLLHLNYRIFIPVFLPFDKSPSGQIQVFSPYMRKKPKGGGVQMRFIIGEALDTPLVQTNDFYIPQLSVKEYCESSKKNRLVFEMHLKPRLAVLKEGWEEIGGEDDYTSMWKKSFSLSKQQMWIKISSVYDIEDKNSLLEEDGFLVGVNAGITRLE